MLPEHFFLSADWGQFHIQLELPVDASITATQVAAARLTELVKDSGAKKVSWYFELQSRGKRFPLESVASVSLRNEVALVPRMNRKRMNLVSGFITAGSLPWLSLQAFKQRLEASGFELPPGYTLQCGGEASQRDDAVRSLMANVGVLALVFVPAAFRLLVAPQPFEDLGEHKDQCLGDDDSQDHRQGIDCGVGGGAGVAISH